MEFYQPQRLTEAVKLAGEGKLYLAGGTDLVLQLKHKRPNGLISLENIPELRKITKTKTHLQLGSMVTFSELAGSQPVRELATALWQCTRSMGSPQIRNRATLGGNLANRSAAADSIPPLLALDAELVLCTASGSERFSVAEFLQRGEQFPAEGLIRSICIPLKGLTSSFYKLGRREALAIARISVALGVKLKGDRAGKVNLALGAVGPCPFLARDLGKNLGNRIMDETWASDAAKGTQRLVAQALGERSTAPYKRVAVAGVVRGAIHLLGEGGPKDG